MKIRDEIDDHLQIIYENLPLAYCGHALIVHDLINDMLNQVDRILTDTQDKIQSIRIKNGC